MQSEQVNYDKQKLIIQKLNVSAQFEAGQETQKRVEFIKTQILLTKRSTLVLGISGGIDSTVAGRLAQLAVESLRQQGEKAQFIAMRLPYGTQKDEADAQQALEFINPDTVYSVNIKPACDAMLSSLLSSGIHFRDEAQQDFVMGNIKARQRMISQYAVAGATDGLVIGTDQAAEALMGFFTKYGDGACDIAPLEGLTKRRVRKIAMYLNAPTYLTNKVPTADLEDLSPLKPDELAFGISYNDIDDFLEGKIVPESVYKIIYAAFKATAHKRSLPVTP
ncbi:NAD+ synthetase [Legionella busanensis]|uniref:NH(3)-dependent NAD(+) synthetase n=1 Tax=Legionella busanensis TaxID=190655 RepID=A0A378KAV8_9GAMM|nr:ammonia-dependent NAD(+) synthetase [Legionella busanensis]STX81313.1 NAD+ synthetase [Legionella busanensis]